MCAVVASDFMPDIFQRNLEKAREINARIAEQKAGVFYWTNAKKERIALPAMQTSYIVNCLKLIINRALPFHLRVADIRKGPVQIADREEKSLIAAMFRELACRNDVPEEMLLLCAKLADLARKHL